MTRDLARGQELVLNSNQVLLIHENDVCYQDGTSHYRYGTGKFIGILFHSFVFPLLVLVLCFFFSFFINSFEVKRKTFRFTLFFAIQMLIMIIVMILYHLYDRESLSLRACVNAKKKKKILLLLVSFSPKLIVLQLQQSIR